MPVKLAVPEVELVPCNTANTIEDRVNIMRLTGRDLDNEPMKIAERIKLLEENPDLRKELVEKIMGMIDTEGCNREEVEHVTDFAGAFGLDGEPLPATNLLMHEIKLTTDKPLRAKRFRYPPKISEQIQIEVEKLRAQGIIEPSNSPYSSNLWAVPKKADSEGNKKQRVNDFRGLNEITVGSCLPLPFTSDILEILSAAEIITVMDLKPGFHQIPIHPDSVSYTAFSTPVGKYGHQHYQFKRMAMGLKEATNTLSRAMSMAGL